MTARRIRSLLGCVVFGFFCGGIMAESPRVVVKTPDDGDLRRTALRLNLCEERVQELRDLLQRAADLALVLEDQDLAATDLSALAEAWISLDRSTASAVIGQLIGRLRQVAENAALSDTYSKATRESQRLVWKLQNVDPVLASRIRQNWPPDPAASPGPAVHGGSRQGQERQAFYEVMQRDPLEAINHLNELETARFELGLRSSLIHQLARKGHEDQAALLFDETLQKVQLSGAQPNDFFPINNLVRMTCRQFPEKLEQIVPLWAELFEAAPVDPNIPSAPPLKVGDQTVQLNINESQVLNTMRQIASIRPSAALKAMQHFPALAQKLEPVGGFEGHFSYSSRPGSSAANEGFEVAQALGDRASREGIEAFRLGLQEEKDPLKRLTNLFHMAQVYYQQSRYDPSLGKESLDLALQAAEQLDNREHQATALRHLSELYGRYEGIFPDRLIQFFFTLVESQEHDDRETANRVAPGGPSADPSHSRSIIQSFLPMWLKVDSPAALSYLAGLDDPQLEFETLAQALSRIGGQGNMGMSFFTVEFR